MMVGYHSLGVLSVVQQPAASSTSFQTKKMVLRSRAPSRSSSLSSTLVRVAAATSVSSLKSWSVPAPFSYSTNNSFSSAHFLRLRFKVSRFAACVYTTAPVDCQAEPVSPLPQHTPLPLVAACPWLLPDSLPTFFKSSQRDRQQPRLRG